MRNAGLTILIISMLVACRDSGNEPTVDSEGALFFPNTEGNFWEYETNYSESLKFTVTGHEDVLWADSFFDTSEKVTRSSALITALYSSSGFPKRKYFALAETDSFYRFGCNTHDLLEDYKNIEADFFIEIFKIPRFNISDTTIVKKKTTEKYNYTIAYKDSITISDVLNAEIEDINTTFNIRCYCRYTNSRTGETKSLIREYQFEENLGPVAVDLYHLTGYDLIKEKDK